jgi:hypothetical protein
MPTIVPRVPVKLRPRVDWLNEEFRKQFYTRSVSVLWEMCNECPCSNSNEGLILDLPSITTDLQKHGEVRSDCPTCKGIGYFWHSKQETRALITSASNDQSRFHEFGEYARGMVNITLLPETLPGFGDRFTMVDSSMRYNETRVRKAGAVQTLRNPIVPRILDTQGGATTMRVLNLQVANISGVTPSTSSLIEGVDFDVTDDGEIDFTKGDLNGHAPLVGVRFAITYFAHPRYYVADNPHTHRDSRYVRKSTDENIRLMPVQCKATLEFMGLGSNG